MAWTRLGGGTHGWEGERRKKELSGQGRSGVGTRESRNMAVASVGMAAESRSATAGSVLVPSGGVAWATAVPGQAYRGGDDGMERDRKQSREMR